MAIRPPATYEFIDQDGSPAGMVRLPLVDYAQPDSDSAPVATCDLPGVVRYRREDEAA
jgi:hypothetical protein